MSACGDLLHLLWTEHFKDPSQFRDDSGRQPLLWNDDWPWELRQKVHHDILDSLKACGRQKDLHKGRKIHADILQTGSLKRDVYISTALIRMYAKCGALANAQEVFDGLPTRNGVTWNVLIAGYAKHGLGEEALNCLGQMRDEGFSPDTVTFTGILKACGSIQATEKGEQIHSEVRRLGLLGNQDILLGTALVDMYAKCGAFTKAQEVFDGLPVRDIVSWNTIISGYAQHGLGEEALNCFEQMRDEGLSPNPITFVCVLKACSSIGATEKGKEIHAEIQRLGLLDNGEVILGNALVNMYAKCGVLTKAQEVFDGLLVRDTASWNALITGYAQHGLGEEALNCFGHMRDEGFSPNVITFVCVLKACGSIGATEKGKEIHAEVDRLGLLKNHDIVLGTALLDMYAKCGALAKAQQVFDGLSVRNAVAWNALIAGYAQRGFGEEALDCFGHMRDEGLLPDTVTFVCVLKACGSIGAVEKGKEIHGEIHKMGLLQNCEIVLGNALVSMYAKCRALAEAQEVFDGLPVRDAVCWNALIAGYAQHGLSNKALNCFGRMRDEGMSPDAVTFICALTACGSIGAAEKGTEIHAEVHRLGLLQNREIELGNALVNMYAKCGALVKAREVFDGLLFRDIVSWNALISGYAQHGLTMEALNCFERMGVEGFTPDIVTIVCVLKACGNIGASEKGKEIHTEVQRLGLWENHEIELGNALVDMYAKCGTLVKAREVFDGLLVRDAVTWNALISGYVQHGRHEEALNCFGQMQDEGISPDTFTFLCILKACGSIGATEKGEEIHAEVYRLGLLENHDIIIVGTALVDMYAKCGALVKAQEIFYELPIRDAVAWTALMAGYGRLGKAKRVFELFSKMRGECVEPDCVTFSVLLTACSHAGLVEEGQMYFDIMSSVYCIMPGSEHYTCLVDLFGRAGHFDKAMSVIEKVPDSDLWLALLSACRNWVNVELGRWAFEHVLQLDDKRAAAYICMSNLYAAAGMQEEADEVEALRTKNGAWKMQGRCWWTDVGGKVHLFTVGDKSHPQSNCMFAKLKDIGQKQLEGYSLPLHWVSEAASDHGEEDVLCGHSEKLAIACALINTPERTPIHVTKNMRVCGDCHFATSLISKMEKRKIQVKDTSRIHIFVDGKCICEETGNG